MLKSIENKSDHKMWYSFVNGYTLSVIWDSGAYSSNYGHMFVKPIEAATQVEIAIISPAGELLPIDFKDEDGAVLEVNTENCCETVAGYVGVEHLPFLFEHVGGI